MCKWVYYFHLLMVLHSHAECIDKDCYHYPSVEVLAVHNPHQNGSGIMYTHTHTILMPGPLFFHILVSFALFWADVWPLFLSVRFSVGVAINTVTFLGANWAGGRLWRHQPNPAVHTHTRACARKHTCSEGQHYLILHIGRLGLHVSKTNSNLHKCLFFPLCLYRDWLSKINQLQLSSLLPNLY